MLNMYATANRCCRKRGKQMSHFGIISPTRSINAVLKFVWRNPIGSILLALSGYRRNLENLAEFDLQPLGLIEFRSSPATNLSNSNTLIIILSLIIEAAPWGSSCAVVLTWCCHIGIRYLVCWHLEAFKAIYKNEEKKALKPHYKRPPCDLSDAHDVAAKRQGSVKINHINTNHVLFNVHTDSVPLKR